jgi:alpha-L-arabinofuranosidase
MTNQGDLYFNKVISKDEKDTTLAASCVQDSKTGDIIIKLVNAGNESKSMNIDLSSFPNIGAETERTIFTGDADDENTLEEPTKVSPKTESLNISGNTIKRSFPGNLLTIIRIPSVGRKK